MGDNPGWVPPLGAASGEWVQWRTDDGSYNGVSLSVSGDVCTYDDSLAEPVSEITWEAELDTESLEPEIHMAVSQWYELWRKAKAYDDLLATCVHAPHCACE